MSKLISLCATSVVLALGVGSAYALEGGGPDASPYAIMEPQTHAQSMVEGRAAEVGGDRGFTALCGPQATTNGAAAFGLGPVASRGGQHYSAVTSEQDEDYAGRQID